MSCTWYFHALCYLQIWYCVCELRVLLCFAYLMCIATHVSDIADTLSRNNNVWLVYMLALAGYPEILLLLTCTAYNYVWWWWTSKQQKNVVHAFIWSCLWMYNIQCIFLFIIHEIHNRKITRDWSIGWQTDIQTVRRLACTALYTL